MSQNVYELIALAARYGFTALMVLIVLRAWRLTIVDSRRAQTLRRLSPETGLSGELIVMEGDQQAPQARLVPADPRGPFGARQRRRAAQGPARAQREGAHPAGRRRVQRGKGAADAGADRFHPRRRRL